jgi:hypothetical protein
MNGERPWALVGPWYRWSQPNDPAAGRQSRPVFQKYETARFVNEFLKDPQHSLKFNDDDFVSNVVLRTDIKTPDRKLSRYDSVKSDVRKIFLTTHKRFYLVACELHCDGPGFPTEDRDKVCEAGFVVRRRRLVVPEATRVQSGRVMAQLAAVEPALRLDAAAPWRVRKPLFARRDPGTYSGRYQGLLDELSTLGVQLTLEGWIASPFDGVGSWTEVAETPQAVADETTPPVAESTFPLYPLVADPRVGGHAGRGRSIYFGTVPTGGLDVDAAGNPRFDDQALYEIRCFVRRHRPQCPKTGRRNDCHGELSWSRRTESYRLASQFDLVGTSNQPITIQMPSLPALEAQAFALPAGKGAPVRMVSPEDSALEFSVDNKGKPIKKGAPGQAICSFAIPLITIVATFVLQLFLPIVVFVFGLWFLLKLKFCIPPALSISGDVAIQLNARANADLDVNLAGKINVDLAKQFNDLNAELGPKATTDMQAQFTPGALGEFVAGVSVNFSPDAPTDHTAIVATLPPVTAGLEFEARVEDTRP